MQKKVPNSPNLVRNIPNWRPCYRSHSASEEKKLPALPRNERTNPKKERKESQKTQNRGERDFKVVTKERNAGPTRQRNGLREKGKNFFA